jgi:hypothetical protein
MAFDTGKDASAYISRRCPGVSVKRVWKCDKCGQVHFEGRPPSPSGDHSGKPRDSKYPREPFVPFRRKAMRESAFGAQAELPRREVQDNPKAEAPKPVKPPVVKRQEGMLF